MPIAIKDSTIDITSEKLTKELAKEFTKYLIEWPQLVADKQDIKSITLTFNYLNQLNDRTVDIKV